MPKIQYLRQGILDLFEQPDPERFDELALELFHYQYRHNPVYRSYVSLVGKDDKSVHTPAEIPYLPVGLFRSHEIRTGDWVAERSFTSSATTGQHPATHFLRDQSWYNRVAANCFRYAFGGPEEYSHYALLPAYLERTGSSLVHMVQQFVELGGGGFYLYDTERLLADLADATGRGRQCMLWGVSFALLDLAESKRPTLPEGLHVVETGGMKGRRRELVREELHSRLRAGFSLQAIHSEYGMTEMLSQAYAIADGRYTAPPTVRVVPGSNTDPFATESFGAVCVLRIADLANIDTCAFIAVEDQGRVYEDGSFEVLGRLDHSEMRGCNLLYTG